MSKRIGLANWKKKDTSCVNLFAYVCPNNPEIDVGSEFKTKALAVDF